MHGEDRALAGFRPDRQPSIVPCQYMLDDGKAKPRAFVGAARADIDWSQY